MIRAVRASTLLTILTTLLVLAAEVRAEDLKIGLVLTHRGRGEIDAKAIQVATEAFLFSRRFTVLERTGLDVVFQEKGLQGFIGHTDGDAEGTADLSHTQGLDWIGLLSYAVEETRERDGQRTSSYLLSVRMLDVARAQVVHIIDSRPQASRISERIQAVGERLLDEELAGLELAELAPDSSDSMEAAGQRLLENLLAAFPPEGYVIQLIDDRQVVVDLGAEHGLREGDSLEVFIHGPTIIHPVTGEEIQGREITQAVLKVLSVDAGLSTCKVRKGEGQVEVGALVRFQAKDNPVDRLLGKLPFGG